MAEEDNSKKERKSVEVEGGFIREWDSGKGIEWHIMSLPNGDFVRLEFGEKRQPEGSYPDTKIDLWVLQMRDSNWPIEGRAATSAEIESFVIVANENLPGSEWTRKLTDFAVEQFRIVSATFAHKADRLEEKYPNKVAK